MGEEERAGEGWRGSQRCTTAPLWPAQLCRAAASTPPAASLHRHPPSARPAPPHTCGERVLHPRLQHLDHHLLAAAAQHRGVHLRARACGRWGGMAAGARTSGSIPLHPATPGCFTCCGASGTARVLPFPAAPPAAPPAARTCAMEAVASGVWSTLVNTSSSAMPSSFSTVRLRVESSSAWAMPGGDA